MPRRISLESAIDEWLEALRLTKPRPHGWQSDFDATGWGDTELPELLRARRNDDLQGPTVNESHRRECMRLWTTAILSEQRESGARRKQLDITDLGSEALLNATQALCRRLTGSDYDDLAGRYGMIVIGGESSADPAPPESVRDFAEHLVVMDEFCRWATWRGYFRFDPFAESRPSTAAVKTYHGGPALDSSYFIDVALSGGGHRAALYGLGALMAVHDTARTPRRISSVSGGSITNAYLGGHYWSHPESESEERWEAVTKRFLDMIVDHGLLTSGWLNALRFLLLFPPVALLAAALGRWLPGLVVLLLTGVWFTALLFRGLLVEWLIGRRVIGRDDTTLWSLHGDVEHVICCTDLAAGAPFYASSEGWLALGGASQPIVYRGALDLSIARLVRASAGFPGIPPRRLSVKSYTAAQIEPGEGPSIVFLSDGGIWNNLATQPFEDGLLPNAYTILVADASAPISRVGYRRFQIPAVAEIAALVRQGIIQNTNTVDPRRDRYRDRIRLETILPGDARFKAERLCVVSACVDTPRDVVARFRAYSQDRYKDAVGPPTREGRDGVEERIEQLLTDPRLQQLQQLALPAGESWGDEEPVATFGTTLGKVPRDIAVALVGRGYANTAVTLYLTRLVDELAMPSGWLAEHAAAPR